MLLFVNHVAVSIFEGHQLIFFCLCRSRWRKAEGNTFGNDIYSIEFQCDKSKPPLFGAKYNFHLEGVVNCPEFLVYQPMLRKLGAKFGLDLLRFEG